MRSYVKSHSLSKPILFTQKTKPPMFINFIQFVYIINEFTNPVKIEVQRFFIQELCYNSFIH